MTNPLPPGIYVPIPTFFLDKPADEQPVDAETLARHVKYLVTSGVHGVVCMGSTGEAVHLDEEERQVVLRTARKAIDETGTKAKLIAGCGQESVRSTLRLINQAKQAGAEYAMLLPPSYNLNLAAARFDVIENYFTKVADKSPLPIIIYNYPGVTQGIDIPGDLIVKLAAHSNIVGIKCTDCNVSKAAYVCERIDPKKFNVMSGSADSFLPFLSIGAQGVVPGSGNVLPRVVCQMFDLFTNNLTDQFSEIQRLQRLLIAGDQTLFRTNGLSGVKAGMQSVLGYGGLTRAPLQPTSQELLQKILNALQPVLAVENELAGKSSKK